MNFRNLPSRRVRRSRRAIILLVVLATLTFFSVLVAAYLVFSKQSRQSSVAIALREVNQVEPNLILNEGLMTLIRGTGNEFNPFFGEDLLSDFYGRSDREEATLVQVGSQLLPGSNFAQFGTSLPVDNSALVNDEYTGRIATFLSNDPVHPLVNQSFEIIRSVIDNSGGMPVQILILNVGQSNPALVPVGARLSINGHPRNSPEIGYDGSGVTKTAPPQAIPVGGITGLPAAIQPNHLGATTDKSTLLSSGAMFNGDFDEPYDAADHNNWYLSHRREDGSVIPSFHRPAVINYLLNQPNALSNGTNLAISLARGTFRPLPIHQSHDSRLGPTDPALNESFTGGNASFGLRAPLQLNSPARIDQLARALIEGPWDVDNDADGVPDSVWIDMGLPTFTSQDGKLIQPLIAPMVVDLSGRLNVNAHGNYATTGFSAGATGIGSDWAGNPANPFFFRGKGAGPADINFPQVNAADLQALYAERYRSPVGTNDVMPGKPGVDTWTLLRDGRRPQLLNAFTHYNGSVDPFGRSVLGIAPSGGIQVAGDGAPVAIGTVTANNRNDNPYEFSPSQQLNGDSPFTVAELEVILRQFDFDLNLLPNRLRRFVQPLITSNPDLSRSLTTISKSSDVLPMLTSNSGDQSPMLVLARQIIPTITQAQIEQLIAPEIRLGRKIDLNRPFGNGVDDFGTPGRDDNNDGTIDEAGELNGVIDEPAEVAMETQSFVSSDTSDTIPTPFGNAAHAPNYQFGTTAGGRQLLARHLFVLMMTVSNSIADVFPTFGDTIGVPPQVISGGAAEMEDVIRRRFRARRLAQWAVNVVDFRDPDSIMTPFEYDEDLSDGWSVDDNLLTNDGAFRGLVWGVENPELLFTESMSFHNLNVRDTDLDVSMQPKGTNNGDDDDTDQLRLPQGSLFLELYCTRQNSTQLLTSTNPTLEPEAAGIPLELYDLSSTPFAVQLDLDRTVLTRFNSTTGVYGNVSDPGFATPVWRIAISEPHSLEYPAANAESPLVKRITHPDRLSFQPEAMDQFDPAASIIQLDRFVLFNLYASDADLATAITPIMDMSPGGTPAPDRVFFNRLVANPAVGPEQYLNLAPRATTHLGSRVYGGSNEPTGPSNQRFEVQADGLIQFDLANTRLTPNTANEIQPGRSLVLQGIQPASWGTVGFRPGLNVSEPLPSNYYQEPTSLLRLSTDVVGYPLDSYARLANDGSVADGTILDQPQDIATGGPIHELTQLTTPGAVDPIQGSFANYRTAFLQRLADPTAGYDPIRNPYRTVDQIPIDLTVFSGESPSTALISPADGAPVAPSVTDVVPGSRQKDGVAVGGSTTRENILFSYSTMLPIPEALPPPVTDHFQLPIATTFNFLNIGFGSPTVVPGLSRGRPSAIGGTPTMFPFAMQPFLNRPFSSPLELLLVPACSQGRLLEEFTVAPQVDPTVYNNFSDAVNSQAYAASFISPFRHLLNFFHARRIKTDALGVASPPAAEFATALDFMTAGMKFRDEESFMVRDSFAGTVMDELYSPPFNKLVSQDRGGRINLNTLSDFTTYAGLMQGHMIPEEFTMENSTNQLGFRNFLQSRRGYSVPGTAQRVVPLMPGDPPPSPPFNYLPDHLDSAFPTEFAGVFKPSTFSEFAIELSSSTATNNYERQLMRRRSSDAGLLRANGDLKVQEPQTLPAAPIIPLLSRANNAGSTVPPHLNRTRDPMLRYQHLMRMPNLVSDNSQVFAIWMTLGFFEVDPQNVESVGSELDASRGNARRFKALFIVDRSIPVGFIPGQDLNARDIVIFERFFQ